MNHLPSILLIDDETEFQATFAESLREETQKKLFQVDVASSGKQGLKIIKNNSNQGRKTFAFIDIILPDILGDKLVDEIDRDHSNTKGILISAHKSRRELEQIKKKYSWIVNSLGKPLDRNQLKNLIYNFIDNSSLGNSNFVAFDYTSLDQQTADFVLQETEKIKTLMRQTVEGIIETGERLHKVKQRLKHGEFMTWVENEIKCHYSTALHFMRVWQTFGEQKEQIADVGINVSVLYLLSAPSTPEEFRTKIVRLAQAGNSISFSEVKRLKKEYIQQKSEGSSPQLSAVASDSITTIDVSADSAATKPQVKPQKIVNIIPQARTQSKFWNLGKHLLFCGSVQSLEFRKQLPAQVSLNIGFPNLSSWEQKALFPIPAKSTLVFHSVFQDLDLVTLRNIIQRSIELCTESGEEILFSFLPYPEMLILAENLNCKCFIAESDVKRCENIIAFWQHVHNQN